MENNTILVRFQAFTWNQMSDASNLFKAVKKAGIGVDQFIGAVDAEIEAKKKQIREDAVKAKAAYGKLANPPTRKETPPAPPLKKKEYPETLACPDCRHDAYVQSVCPNCAKGRAGIRKQYICGECNFAFYLD